jgi:hypothetical protein
VLVKIFCRVRKGCEDEHLFVPWIDRGCQFTKDRRLDVLELGIVRRRDLAHFSEEVFDSRKVGTKLMFPAREVHIGKIDLDLVADLPVIRFGNFVIVIRLCIGKGGRYIGERGITTRFLKCSDLIQRPVMIVGETR